MRANGSEPAFTGCVYCHRDGDPGWKVSTDHHIAVQRFCWGSSAGYRLLVKRSSSWKKDKQNSRVSQLGPDPRGPSMRCPACIEKNQRSCVYDDKTTASAPTKAALYYDEDGRRHRHDTAIISRFFTCDKGHRFVVVTQGSCWCGWNSTRRPSVTIITPPATVLGPSSHRMVTDEAVVAATLTGSTGSMMMES